MIQLNPMNEKNESQATILCKSCGMCCTGHLFLWAKLRPSELDPAEALGLNVFRSDPSQRGFSQPCPLWRGQCTIYERPQYPHVCRAYKCKLLKEVITDKTSLTEALQVVGQAKKMIQELDVHLPHSSSPNFRERLVAYVENQQQAEAPSSGQKNTELELRPKAEALLAFYEEVFGVDDLIEKTEDWEAE
jgi:uncharacterized protein